MSARHLHTASHHRPQHEPHAPVFAPTICAAEAAARKYDAVIVGAGISGAILAHELTSKGYRVLIVEAGLGRDLSQHGNQRLMETFFANPYTDNNEAFVRNPNAEMPRSSDLRKLAAGETNAEPYLVQSGPYVSDSVYSRVLGGTTVHWEAKTIRMLREDFKLKTNYGQGLDWPIGLDDLMPYYDKAERALGVSGDAESQRSVGVEFTANDYVYPMVALRASWLDQNVANGLKGMQAEAGGEKFDLTWITFPQAKNADPNPAYAKWNGGQPYQPMGAVSTHQDDEGERCQGNTNCVPLCPVQARFDARKILIKAIRTGLADLVTQAVASRVHIHPESGVVTGIEVKRYESRESADYRTYRMQGKVSILAANAVENARLMLASAVQNGQPVNDLIGRHLMDHPYLLCWGRLPEAAGVGRGPSCTSGLCNFRRGEFRHEFASFAADIHNDGWGWATGAPVHDLMELVDGKFLHGRALREQLIKHVSTQLLLAYMIEMPANPASRVTVSEKWVDRLRNMKPMISAEFKPPKYSMETAEYAYKLSDRIFKGLGASNDTNYPESDYGRVSHKGMDYAIRGGNHLAGTHVMGTDRGNSVVDENQKAWDNPNLYLVGPGSMPSIGSSNTTLTTAALCYKTAEAVLSHLKQL